MDYLLLYELDSFCRRNGLGSRSQRPTRKMLDCYQDIALPVLRLGKGSGKVNRERLEELGDWYHGRSLVRRDGCGLLAALASSNVGIYVTKNSRPPIPVNDELLRSCSVPVAGVVMQRPQYLQSNLLRRDGSDPILRPTKQPSVPGKGTPRVLLDSAPLRNILLDNFFTFEVTVRVLHVRFHVF